MSRAGFQLVRLALSGPGVEDAEVRFSSGLNVVTGPSDTGKTFILQCIDFMLGARDKPEEVPEAAPYDTLQLGIRASADNREMTLRRSLQGGAFALSIADEEDRVLREQHAADREDTVSHFLLALTGLSEKQVRKNQRGVTRSLSFRDLAHLTIVSEEDVIRTVSPILTGQYTSATAEKSVFRLLLSGLDDSSVVASEEPRISRTRVEAKVEVLQGLIERTRRQLEELHIDADLAALRDQLGRLDRTYQDASAELSTTEQSVATIEEQRRSTWTRLRQIESRLDLLSGLGERFELLARQYASDLRRLEAIAETGTRLGELKMERCPVCGAPAEHHDEEHQDIERDPTVVAAACSAEARKIRSLISDLEVTQRDVRDEVTALDAEKLDRQAQLASVTSAIRERLRPQVQDALHRVRQSQERREEIRPAVDLLERLEELNDIVNEVSGAPSEVSGRQSSREVRTTDTEAFCAEVEERLQAWNFPELGRVTFSESDWDIVIAGQRRTSHGKGVRAVTHAAFNLALLRYCTNRQLPHPGFVVIDSPLVVYREPDADEEGFSQDVKASFFTDTATSFADSQVIVLENEEPPGEVAKRTGVNVIRFTGTHVGRRGFIPASRGSAE